MEGNDLMNSLLRILNPARGQCEVFGQFQHGRAEAAAAEARGERDQADHRPAVRLQIEPERARDLTVCQQQQRPVGRVAVVGVRGVVLARPRAVRRVVHVEYERLADRVQAIPLCFAPRCAELETSGAHRPPFCCDVSPGRGPCRRGKEGRTGAL